MSRHYHGTLRIVLVKSLTYLMIYAVMATYMLCLVPKMFSLVQIAQAGTLAEMCIRDSIWTTNGKQKMNLAGVT